MGTGLSSFEKNAIDLLDQGATIPFLARYRKESTGGMDEVELFALQERYTREVALKKRKESILKILQTKELLSKGIEIRIRKAETLEFLEEIYAPYKTGTKTRAQKARDQGLEVEVEKLRKNPALFGQYSPEAQSGIQDIFAEEFAHESGIRRKILELCLSRGTIHAKLSKEGKSSPEEAANFSDYFDSEQKIRALPGHRVLAMLRGKKLGILRLKLVVPEEFYQPILLQALPLGWSRELEVREIWLETLRQSWKRLIFPSLEKEVLRVLKEQADSQATEVFARNLRSMFAAPGRDLGPLLAIDPGFRTGCKVVVLDSQGQLLDRGVIFPLEPKNHTAEAELVLTKYISTYVIEAVALGNGTGGRETEEFLKSWCSVPVFMVDERGASVYSASPGAREEFPTLDLTFRSAVSIGRRLQDPINELVKVEPQALGVGQYQHDIDQKFLAKKLSEEVLMLVNNRGVDVNRGGRELLGYVSGLDSKKVEKILSYRNKAKGFRSRKDLLKVPSISAEVFQQCAGFLKVEGGEYPLDSTAIHPELYSSLEDLAIRHQIALSELLGSDNFHRLDQEIIRKWKTEVLFSQGHYGEPTWEFISRELRDLGNKKFEQSIEFDPEIRSIDDLEPGQVLKGKVTNLTTFGAFVDLGIHLDGLIHISQMSTSFIRDPGEVVSLGQIVLVKVLAIDSNRKRVSLSLSTEK